MSHGISPAVNIDPTLLYTSAKREQHTTNLIYHAITVFCQQQICPLKAEYLYISQMQISSCQLCLHICIM